MGFYSYWSVDYMHSDARAVAHLVWRLREIVSLASTRIQSIVLPPLRFRASTLRGTLT
jgi:hypothetical protein